MVSPLFPRVPPVFFLAVLPWVYFGLLLQACFALLVEADRLSRILKYVGDSHLRVDGCLALRGGLVWFLFSK